VQQRKVEFQDGIHDGSKFGNDSEPVYYVSPQEAARAD